MSTRTRILWCVSIALALSCTPACSKNANRPAAGSIAGDSSAAGGSAPAADSGGAGTPAVAGSGSPIAGASPTPPIAGNRATAAGASGAIAGAGMPATEPAPSGAAGAASSDPDHRDVLLVGNSVSGTVSVLDAHSFENLGSVNVTPDLAEVMELIDDDFSRAIAYPVVKNSQLLHHFEPSNGDRFVDDVFVSPDGTTLYVSRSNLGDVAAFDLTQAGHPQKWRMFVDGVKADHATISPDGKRLVVSATTATVANVIDTQTGKIVGSFPTGSVPHQNDYSADGKHVYNSSIGNVGYKSVSYADNDKKGNRWLVKADAQTFEVKQTWKFDYGIRPNIVTADEKTLYTQLSYLNGVVKYDLVAGREIAQSDQPLSEFALQTYKTYDEYPHDSAHHGLALSGDGKRLCDCGTIDNTVSIVTTADMKVEKTIEVGMIPYWATSSADGSYCFVSLSGDGTVAVIDYRVGAVVKVVPVGKFPQRNRLARLPARVVAMLKPSPG